LIFRLNYDRNIVHPVFLQRLLMTGKVREAVRGLASGSAASMPNISKARLVGLHVPVPPMRDQESFAAMSDSIASRRAAMEEHLGKLRVLTASLQARAFSGRL
jgi:type I restriction enzyme S subunit